MNALMMSLLMTAAASHATPQKPPPQSQQQAPEKGRTKAKKKRVVSDLSGFDLLDPRKQTTAVGATRGLSTPVPLAPRLGKVYGGRPVFSWSYKGRGESFVFVLWSDAQEELFRAQVTGRSYPYPNEAPRLEPGKTYLWTVQSSLGLVGGPSVPAGFIVIGPEQQQEVEKVLAAIIGGEPYQARIARARVLTDNRLWYDAVAAYTELIARYPNRAQVYEERGMIYAQLEVTKDLAEADFVKVEELAGKAAQ